MIIPIYFIRFSSIHHTFVNTVNICLKIGAPTIINYIILPCVILFAFFFIKYYLYIYLNIRLISFIRIINIYDNLLIFQYIRYLQF